MLNSLRCKMKGHHVFVDSRSMPGMQTCVRCRLRQPFQSAPTETRFIQAKRSDRPRGASDAAA